MKYHDVEIPSEKIAEFCNKWKIGDFGPESDLDFLISFESEADWDLWDLVRLREELISIVGREVDIVFREALRNPYRRKEILLHREIIHAA